MDKHDSHIEEQFRKVFENFQLEVTDTDFSAIERKLGAQRKKKRFWWWFGGLLILVAISGFLFYYLGPSSNNFSPYSIQTSEIREMARKDLIENQESTSTRNKFEHNQTQTEITSKKLVSHALDGKFVATASGTQSDSLSTKRHSFELLGLVRKQPGNFDTSSGFDSPLWIVNISRILRCCPSISDHPPLYYLSNRQISVQISAGQSKPEWKASATDQNLLGYRQANEKPSVYSEISLLAARQKYGWMIQSGAGYQELSTQSNQFKLQLYDSIPVLNPLGDTLGFFRLNYRDTSIAGSYRNTYRYLFIPIQISKSMLFNNRNSLILGAGLQFQVLTGVSGQYAQSANLPAPLTKDLLSTSLTQWNLNIGYERLISPDMGLLVAIRYQEPFGGIKVLDQNIEMKLRQIGVSIQLNYRFPNKYKP